MNNPIIKFGCGAIIIEDNKILLAKRKGSTMEGYWGSMGGHVEFKETPQQACIREAQEELGIEIGGLKFLACTNIITAEKHYMDVSFIGRIIKGVPIINEPDKVSEIGWFGLDQLPEKLFPIIENCLIAYRTGKSYFEINY